MRLMVCPPPFQIHYRPVAIIKQSRTTLFFLMTIPHELIIATKPQRYCPNLTTFIAKKKKNPPKQGHIYFTLFALLCAVFAVFVIT